MKDLVTYIVKAIVETPDAVNVEESTLPDGKIILTINTAPTDVGLVIGRMGKTINAIRSLVKIQAIKQGKFVDVKVPSDRDNGAMGASSQSSTAMPAASTDDMGMEEMPTTSNVTATPDTTATTGEFDAPDF